MRRGPKEVLRYLHQIAIGLEKTGSDATGVQLPMDTAEGIRASLDKHGAFQPPGHVDLSHQSLTSVPADILQLTTMC